MKGYIFKAAWHQEYLHISLGNRELRTGELVFHFQPAPIKQPASIASFPQVREQV